MTKDEREKIYQKALDKWGANSQMACAVEEFSELNVELCKLLNGKRTPNSEELIDELADSAIMLEQMLYIFVLENKVKHRMTLKLERLEERLNGK